MTDEEKPKDAHLFKPGKSPNPAGRPKDIISRPNMLKRSRELNIHPEDILLYFAAGDHKALKLDAKEISSSMRLKAAMKALDKIVPDLKSIDYNVSNDTDEAGNKTNVRTVVVLPNNDRQTMPEATADEIVALHDLERGMHEAMLEAEAKELLDESE